MYCVSLIGSNRFPEADYSDLSWELQEKVEDYNSGKLAELQYSEVVCECG